IPNGVDLELFTPREAPRPADGEIKVFFAGNLTRRKGAHWLPEIAQRLPGHINIYYTQGLRTRSALPEHPRLRPLGRIPYQQMPERYRQMDILLIPTVREGLCLAVLEAMASGLPVVATDASSLPEQIVEDRGGHLCPIGDSEAFANRVQLLADDPQARLDMGIFNRRRAEERFGLASMLEAYRRVFQRAVGKA
ncbi:MAG: glycosyltransferase family 4 protein, partial [Acidobacteriota bacterium]